jgi:hypothetical protein
MTDWIWGEGGGRLEPMPAAEVEALLLSRIGTGHCTFRTLAYAYREYLPTAPLLWAEGEMWDAAKRLVKAKVVAIKSYPDYPLVVTRTAA